MKRTGAIAWILILVMAMLSAAAEGTVGGVRLSQVKQRGGDVTMYVDMTDSGGNPYTGNLSPEMFSFSVDGKLVPITAVTPYDVNQQGIHYVFCVDVSKTLTEPMMEDVRQALNETVDAMGPLDTVTILTFGETVQTRISASNDRNAIKEAIGGLQPNENFTALYKGVIDGVQAASGGSRSAVLVITDGKNDTKNGSEMASYTKESIQGAVLAAQVPLYCVGLNDNKGVDTQSLGEFASLTGGMQYVITSGDTAGCLSQIRSILTSTVCLQATLVNEDGRADFDNVSTFRVGFQAEGGDFIVSNELQQMVNWASVPGPVAEPTATPVPAISLEMDKAQVARNGQDGQATITGAIMVDQGAVNEDELSINVNGERWLLDSVSRNGNSFIFSASGVIAQGVSELEVQAELPNLGIASRIQRMSVITPEMITPTPAPVLTVELDDADRDIVVQNGENLCVSGVVNVQGEIDANDMQLYINGEACADLEVQKLGDGQYGFRANTVAQNVESGEMNVQVRLADTEIYSRTQRLFITAPTPTPAPVLELTLTDADVTRAEDQTVTVRGNVEVLSGDVTPDQLALFVNSMQWEATFTPLSDGVYSFEAVSDAVDADVTQLDVKVRLSMDNTVSSNSEKLGLITPRVKVTVPPTMEPTAEPVTPPPAEEQTQEATGLLEKVTTKIESLRADGTLWYWVGGAGLVLVLLILAIVLVAASHREKQRPDDPLKNPGGIIISKDPVAPPTIYEPNPKPDGQKTEIDEDFNSSENHSGDGRTIFIDDGPNDDNSKTVYIDDDPEPAPKPVLEIEISERLVDRRRGIDEQRPLRTLQMAEGDSVLFGRDANDETVTQIIDDPTVSRRHMWLICNEGEALVSDVGTSNHTRLNGKLLETNKAAPLNDGDELALGRTILRVSIRKL